MLSKDSSYNRKSIRIKGYNYSYPGYYFITICTKNREYLFGDIKSAEMILNKLGNFTKKCIKDIPIHYKNSEIDYNIIMPNHIHLILILNNNTLLNPETFQNNESYKNEFQNIIPGSIGSIIRGFKIGVTKWARKHTGIIDVWQRNFYERVIRSEEELYETRKYIFENPLKWHLDKYYKQM